MTPPGELAVVLPPHLRGAPATESDRRSADHRSSELLRIAGRAGESTVVGEHDELGAVAYAGFITAQSTWVVTVGGGR